MKRLISGLMAALMLTALLPATALAAKQPTRDEAAQVLSALNIMQGNEKGDLLLGSTVTRAEFTKMAVSAAPFGDGVGAATSTSPYPDVPRGHWASGYIQAAVDNGLVRGDLYGKFNPNGTITLAEGATIALRLLGYQDSDYSGAYPSGQMALYRTLDLDGGVSASAPNAPLTRGDCLYLFYNLLTAKTKDGKIYLDVLKPADKLVTATGEIDSVALVNTAMEGPVIAKGVWQKQLPFDVTGAKVYRGGVLSNEAAVQQNDIIYWSKSMGTVWVYNNRISGTIQAIAPASAPTSITLAGKTYPIETTAAAYQLSDLGDYKVGDTVTLLLGRDSSVVSVLSSAVSGAGSEVVGIVTAVSKVPYEDANGKSYTASTIELTATDGTTYSYRWDNASARVGSVVRVTNVDGKLEIKSTGVAGLSGKVSADGKRLGGYTLAADVEILDAYSDKAVRVYPARIAGIELQQSDVSYYLLNGQREISKLILKDVTGDMHQYGVLTEATEISTGMTIMGTYVYDIAGVPGGIPQSSKIYNVKPEPIVLKTTGAGTSEQIDRMANLTSLNISSLEGTVAISGNQKHRVSEQVVVYEYRKNNYYLSNVSAVSGGDFSLTGWYDKPEADGGCIRVIIAREKN